MATGSVEIRAPAHPATAEVLNEEVLAFLGDLHRRFNPRRLQLLRARNERQARFDAGEKPGFLEDTRSIRESDWRVAPVPADLQDRRVEITGPTNSRMVINALNSGARVFMADFEDANTPTWQNLVEGQLNLTAALDRTIGFETAEGRTYKLNDRVATLLVRPRGWHLEERHVVIDGVKMSGSLFDFGVYCFRNAHLALSRGTGPYFYLPKMESHLEARLWNEVFDFSEERMGLAHGTIKATVLIETILAAFEIDEILHELRDHSAGCNAGRWDYIFSVIKKFRLDPKAVLPDRAMVTMTVPFMRAYTELLVKTCHRRGAHAIGGMAAFIPNRRDAQVTETAIARVHEDKQREANAGFDGTWVAHPDLVPVALADFDAVMGDRPNQVSKLRPDVQTAVEELLDFASTPGAVTEAGLRNNVSVGLQYLESWLRGTGAVAVFNLMEDVATAEIARSQIWQWLHEGIQLDDGRPVTAELVRETLDEEMAKMTAGEGNRFDDARRIFEEVALGREYVEFLTFAANELID